MGPACVGMRRGRYLTTQRLYHEKQGGSTLEPQKFDPNESIWIKMARKR